MHRSMSLYPRILVLQQRCEWQQSSSCTTRHDRHGVPSQLAGDTIPHLLCPFACPNPSIICVASRHGPDALAMGLNALSAWSRFLLDRPNAALLIMQRYCSREFPGLLSQEDITSVGCKRPLKIEELWRVLIEENRDSSPFGRERRLLYHGSVREIDSPPAQSE